MASKLIPNLDCQPCSFGYIHADRVSTLPPLSSLPDPTSRRAASLDLSLTDPDNLFIKGVQFKENNEYQKAIDAFNGVVQLRWHFADAHVEIGNCASALKDYDRALEAYALALDVDSECVTAYYNTALTYIDMGNSELALTWLKTTIRVCRTYRLAYLQMAQLFASHRQDRAAISLLITAAKIRPPLADPLIAASNLYYRNTDEERAIRCLERAIRLDPWNAHAYYFLGLMRYRKGDFPRAVRSLSFAVNCDPSNKQAAALLRSASSRLRPKRQKSTAVQDPLFSTIEHAA